MVYRNLKQPAKTAAIIFIALLVIPFTLMAEEQSSDYARSVSHYQQPKVTVIRQDGKKLAFDQVVNDGRPVMLNFIFASCSAICPMLSQTFSRVQTKLAKNKHPIHLISISIDPENDTPEKLTEYAKKFNAGKKWDFYTGTLDDSITIQKAFAAYGGDKMNHTSVIFMRAKPNEPWLRLDGFISPDEVITEYHRLLTK